jgi:pyruvate formate lyase activating enzyme
VLIFDIKRFAVHDGPGIRTTVFLKGCPLRCAWCHNPESQSAEPVTVKVERKLNGRSLMTEKTYGEEMEADALIEVLLRDRHFYEESGGGITFSGGEPLMQINALEQMLKECRKEDLHTVVDTCGCVRKEYLKRIVPHTSLFLYDLKHMDPVLHQEYTGEDNRLILENADLLLEMGAKVIFRIPVVPGVNTGPEETSRMVDFLNERRDKLEEVHLLPYHRIAENKYRRLGMEHRMPDTPDPDAYMMYELVKTFEKTGLVVRTGG